MKKVLRILLAPVVLFCTIGYIAVRVYLPEYLAQAPKLVEELSKQFVNGKVTVNNVRWNGRLTFTADNISVYDETDRKLADIDAVDIELAPLKIFLGSEKILSGIIVKEPNIFLDVNEKDEWNWRSFLKDSGSGETPFYGCVEIVDGSASVTSPLGAWNLKIEGNIDGGANPNFCIDAAIKHNEEKLALSGVLDTDMVGYITLRTKEFSLSPFAEIAKAFVPVSDFEAGLHKVILVWKNNGKQVALQGQGEWGGKYVAAQGMQVNDFKIPFVIAEEGVFINKAEALFGDGALSVAAEYYFETGEAKGFVRADQVNYAINTGDKISLNGIIGIDGKFVDNKNMDLNIAANLRDVKWNTLLMSTLDFDANIDEAGANVEKFAAFAQDGLANGSVKIGFDGSLSGNGKITNFPIDAILQTSVKGAKGNLTAGWNLSGSIDHLNFDANTQVKQLNVAGIGVREGHGRLKVLDNVLSIEDYELNMKQGKHLLNGSVDFSGETSKVDVLLSTENVRAEELVGSLYPDIKLTGNVDNELSISGTTDNLNLYGRLFLQDGSIQGVLLDRVSGDYTYNLNDGFELKNGIVQALSTTAVVEGRMDSNKDLDFKLDVVNMALEYLPIRATTAELKGNVNLRGELKGNIDKPEFYGNIAAGSVFINGEELKNIEGDLVSEGFVESRLNCSFEQYPEGIFAADLNLNTQEKDLRGNISFMYGNLRSVLKMVGTPFDIDGTAGGRLTINPNGKRSGIFADMRIDDVRAKNGFVSDRVRFKGRIQDRKVWFDEFSVRENMDFEDKGYIEAQGWMDFATRNLDIKATAKEANPAIATIFMSEPPIVTGSMNMDLQLSGNLKAPYGNAKVNLLNAGVEGIEVDLLKAEFDLLNDVIELKEAVATKDIYKLSAKGDFPLELFLRKEERKNKNAHMNIDFKLDNTRLGVLKLLTSEVEEASGECNGEIKLTGTLEEPLLYGGIDVQNGIIKLQKIDTLLEAINADLDFNGNDILLNNFVLNVGEGQITADGTYGLRSSEDKAYALNVKLLNPNVSSDIFTGRINGEVSIVPKKYFSLNQDGKPVPAGVRPLVQADVKLDDVLINMPTIPSFGEGESNIGLDVKVALGPDIHLYNKYLYDLWLSGGLHVKGSTVYTNIDGNIKADRGTVTYLRTPFKIEKAIAAWPVPGDLLPTVNVAATAKFRRYDISMNVTGPVDTMDLTLKSNPSASKDRIVKMLTLQREVSETGDQVSENDLQNLMTVGLEMTFLSDVEELFKDALGLNEFRIYGGRLRSGLEIESKSIHEFSKDEKNQYNLLVSKNLGDKWMIGYTMSADGEHQSAFSQYALSKHFNVNYARRKDMEEEDHWYGVEYKITFR